MKTRINKSRPVFTTLACLFCLMPVFFGKLASADGYIGLDGTSISVNSAGNGELNRLIGRLYALHD